MTGRRLTDPRELTALAHPLRMSIVEQLTLDGPMTASELGKRLDESPANCSWHLRKLAEHDFVEEAGTEGRRRPWRMSNVGFSWKDADASPDGRRAALALSDLFMGRAVDRLREANERAADEPEEWRASAEGTQTMVWVTAEELTALNTEVREVLMRHVERLHDRSARPPGSRLCELVAWGVPSYLPGIDEIKDSGETREQDR